MNSKRGHEILGKGLFLVALAAAAAFFLGKFESVQAQNDTIRVGESVTDWIPQANMTRLYKLESSAQTLVHITAVRTDGNLAPWITVLHHDGTNYKVAAYDYNDDASDTATVSVKLPVTAVDYWIEVGGVDATSGVFQLSTSLGRTWQQEVEAYSGFRVTFAIARIVCRDAQDGDGLDELDLTYLMQQHTRHGTAIDVNQNRVDDMWMQSGWEFTDFAPLTREVGKDDSVSLTIKLKEEDNGWNDDETLAEGTNRLSPQQLKQAADSGKVAAIYWPVGNGQYQYEILYTVFVEKI